jgi:protein SCO1/2
MHPPRRRRQLLILFFIFLSAYGVLYLGYQRRKREAAQLPVIAAVPDFSFTTGQRKEFGKADLRNHVTIADFIFTSCAGPCPLMSGHMQEFQEKFSDAKDLRLVSFSVDPATDTPPVLEEYGQRFHADPGRWTFLTGDKQTMYGLISKGFLLPVADDSNAIAHSTKFVLIDRSASIRGYYDSEDDSSLTALEKDTRALLAE